MAKGFIVGGWLAEPDLNSFSRDGRIVHVEPKVMELCVRLVQAAGDVVSKAELLESVWPQVSVGEDALTRAISELRRALGDDARNPRIIETIPKRGYRIIGHPEAPAAMQLPDVPRAAGAARRVVLVAFASATCVVIAGLVMSVGWIDANRTPDATGIPTVWVHVAEDDQISGTFVATVQAAIERELTRRHRIALTSRHRIADVRRRMRQDPESRVTVESALEIAQREAIDGIVFGRVNRVAVDYVLTLQILAVPSGSIQETIVLRAGDEGRLTGEIELRLSAVDADLQVLAATPRSPLPAVTTGSMLALRHFAQAVHVAQRVMASEAAPWPSVIELLRKALDEDDDFVMARVWLAFALKEAEDARLTYEGGARESVEVYRRYAAESLSELGGCSEPERLFVEGMAYWLLHQPQRAIAALEALLWVQSDFLEISTRALLSELYASESRLDEADAQIVRLAELLPDDFDLNVLAARAIVKQDGHGRRAAPYVDKARRSLTPAIAQRENSAWLVAWLEHLPVYELWVAGAISEAVEAQRRVFSTLSTRSSGERDAIATTNGYLWLTVGRVAEARAAFDAVGHADQKEWNFAAFADLFDNRRQAAIHLNHVEWAYNPVPFARAGLFARARAIAQEPPLGAHHRIRQVIASAEEALSTGRTGDALQLLQSVADQLRRSPHVDFYNASLSLAAAWGTSGSVSQQIRVLEEASNERPLHLDPGPAGAWWIKVQLKLAEAYDQTGRSSDADVVAARIRHLLAAGDADHPFLEQLNARALRRVSITATGPHSP